MQDFFAAEMKLIDQIVLLLLHDFLCFPDKLLPGDLILMSQSH